MALWMNHGEVDLDAWATIVNFLEVLDPASLRLERFCLRAHMTYSICIPLRSPPAILSALQDLLLSLKDSRLMFQASRYWPREALAQTQRDSLQQTFARLHEHGRLIIDDSDLRGRH